MGFYHHLFHVTLFLQLQSCAQAALLVVNVSPPSTGNLSFSPANTVAAVGDQVRFEFTLGTGNHTITQSAFATPCQPLAGGVDSGSKGAPDNVLVAYADLTINNTEPFYYYSATAHDCRQGMVGTINAPETGNTFDKYKAAAMALPATSSSTSTATPSVSTKSSSGSDPQAEQAKSMGLIGGLVLGTAVIILASVGVWMLRNKLRGRKEARRLATFTPPRFGTNEIDGEQRHELEVEERRGELHGHAAERLVKPRVQSRVYELPGGDR